MVSEPKPFTIKPVLSIQGGYMKKDMLLECEYIDNTPFIALKKTNRNLGKMLGKAQCAQNWSPLSDCDLFEKVKLLRNDKVDEIIKHAMTTNDPLPDAMNFKIDNKQRRRLFTDCKVPDVIEIELPQFVTDEGKHVGVRQLKVASTWNVCNAPSIEATGANMDWLILACQHEWGSKHVSPKRKRDDDDIIMTLPTLPDPLKYRVDPDGEIRIVGYIKPTKPATLWKRRQKKVEIADDMHGDEKHQVIMAVASKVLKACRKHDTTDNDDVSGGDDDETNDENDDMDRDAGADDGSIEG